MPGSAGKAVYVVVLSGVCYLLMVQIQSSWFPHIDRNPQTFVPNIFEAAPADFRAATMRVYHTPARATRLDVLVVQAIQP
jgi:uncharacterized protein